MAEGNSFTFEIQEVKPEEGPPFIYELHAIENNKRYIIELDDKEQWYLGQYYKAVEDEVDLDGDGIKEGLIRTNTSGNCCGPDYYIVKRIEEGFYSLLTHEELSGFPEIKQVNRNNKINLLVYNVSEGAGNISYEHTLTELELINDKLVVVSKFYNNANLAAIMEVTAKELHETKTKQLIYDLDKDGIDDVMDCKYWDRWGAVQCDITTSAKGEVTFGLGCDRLGILETSTDGLSDIICNRRSIVKYSADENRYILLE